MGIVGSLCRVHDGVFADQWIVIRAKASSNRFLISTIKSRQKLPHKHPSRKDPFPEMAMAWLAPYGRFGSGTSFSIQSRYSGSAGAITPVSWPIGPDFRQRIFRNGNAQPRISCKRRQAASRVLPAP